MLPVRDQNTLPVRSDRWSSSQWLEAIVSNDSQCQVVEVVTPSQQTGPVSTEMSCSFIYTHLRTTPTTIHFTSDKTFTPGLYALSADLANVDTDEEPWPHSRTFTPLHLNNNTQLHLMDSGLKKTKVV